MKEILDNVKVPYKNGYFVVTWNFDAVFFKTPSKGSLYLSPKSTTLCLWQTKNKWFVAGNIEVPKQLNTKLNAAVIKLKKSLA